MDFLMYLMRDTVLYEKYTGTNQYNEKEYAEGIEIPCRITKYYKLMNNLDNEQVYSEFKIYTLQEIGFYDKLNGKQVIHITEWKSLYDGQIKGYRSYI